MVKKLMNWKTKGMNQDLSVSAFNPEFSFENRNLRLSTNEGNTTLSWVNEKGTLRLGLVSKDTSMSTKIKGSPIGTAVLDHKLVLFTTTNYAEEKSHLTDYIYVLKYIDEEKTQMEVRELFKGFLNFSAHHPLETHVSFEAEHIQKVYWTDGRNQPRVINIAADKEKYANKKPSNDEIDSQFDFIPKIHSGIIKVNKDLSAGGIFTPGVIQYAFTYYNKYGQQSNIVDISAINYIDFSNRGGSPEEKTSCTFTITISEIENKFDYIRLYAIQRTSIDAVPFVRLLDDIPINEVSKKLTYTDNGMKGSSLDPYELLYLGGKEIKALTMNDKDCTLFMGNFTQVNTLISHIQEKYDSIRSDKSIGYSEGIVNYAYFCRDGKKKHIEQDSITGVYSNTHTLKWNNREITTFKGGDTYRLGFQLQKNTGEWLEPIYMDDIKNYYYPKTTVNSEEMCCAINLPYATATIDLKDIGIDYSNYRCVRPLVVYPNIADREVLCQGVLNPTVFNSIDRIEKHPYAQASWYFRPYTSVDVSSGQIDVPTSTGSIERVSPVPQNPDISIQPPAFSGKTIEMYILVVEVADSLLNSFLQESKVSIEEREYETEEGRTLNNDTKRYTEDFWGAIQLGGGRYAPNSTRLALLNYYQFNEQKDIIEGDGSYHYEYSLRYLNCRYINKSTRSFHIYNGMDFIKGHLLQYSAPAGISGASTYCFKFYTEDSEEEIGTYYKITYANGEEGVSPITDILKGSIVEFNHYSRIYSQDSISYGTGIPWISQSKDKYRMIEIQNSKSLYESPFKDYDDTKDSTNTEFFIDQSIVTLNSPDIDFDTNVQMYGNENLHLRIIGAIPITASSSSHSITASALQEISDNNGNISHSFGKGELNRNIKLYNSLNKSNHHSRRLVADYIWNDTFIESVSLNDHGKEVVQTLSSKYDYLVYPWQRTGSLNNDWRPESTASSWLKTKKEANRLYSMFTEYLQPDIDTNEDIPSNAVNKHIKCFDSVSVNIHLKENDFVQNYRLPKQKQTSSDIDYYPNIDTILYNSDKYPVIPFISGSESDADKLSGPVSMKYKSNSHAVIALNASTKDGNIPILPYSERENGSTVGLYTNDKENQSHHAGSTFWGDTNMLFAQESINSKYLPSTTLDFLWVGELYKDVEKPFGGTETGNNVYNQWQIGGETVELNDGKATIYWTEGDTYYQRYDCLKTYAFTPEDTNQVIEILSFMCETHVNIDGRYDKNRGQIDNTDMNPQNFNLLNPVYSQQDNFFTYKKQNNEDQEKNVYPNLITYSKTKESGADIDLWTNVTLASILELDGDKGEITSLQRLNNQLIAFQDKGISQILYNENVQISSTAGVPIEIANSGKVQGKRYLSDTVGCSNKYSLVNTPTGIYFIDSNSKSAYLFNGQLQSISDAKGFNCWFKQHVPSYTKGWNPVDFNDFVTYYDQKNQEVLWINKDEALAYNEKFGVFTSFYSYGGSPYFCNLDDTGIWLKPYDVEVEDIDTPLHIEECIDLWKHQAGDYCDFFDERIGYSMTLIGNPDPQLDKTFTNLEFRSCVDGDGKWNTGSVWGDLYDNTFTLKGKGFIPYLPFDNVEAWNEYQHGITKLKTQNGRDMMRHHGNDDPLISHLARKFRMWRCDLPRNNADTSLDNPLRIHRRRNPNERLRNPWVYIKLSKETPLEDGLYRKVEVHDVVMTYYI